MHRNIIILTFLRSLINLHYLFITASFFSNTRKYISIITSFFFFSLNSNATDLIYFNLQRRDASRTAYHITSASLFYCAHTYELRNIAFVEPRRIHSVFTYIIRKLYGNKPMLRLHCYDMV